jgi:hypothetical protein
MTTLKGLTERQRAVVATMRMRLTRAQAVAYLRGEGYQMSSTTLGRIKSWLRRTQLQRLHYIASFGFEEQHLTRIDMCEHIEQLMWQNYHLCKDPAKKVGILKEIKELQPYISTYYDTTKAVMEKSGTGQTDNSISKYPTTERDSSGNT